MKKHVYERIGHLMDRNTQLQEKLDQVTGGQVVQRLQSLEATNDDLMEKLLDEKKARQDLLKDVDRLEQEMTRQQRKTDRFNAVKDELELEQHINANLESQLAAARQEIDQLKKNQTSGYLNVV